MKKKKVRMIDMSAIAKMSCERKKPPTAVLMLVRSSRRLRRVLGVMPFLMWSRRSG